MNGITLNLIILNAVTSVQNSPVDVVAIQLDHRAGVVDEADAASDSAADTAVKAFAENKPTGRVHNSQATIDVVAALAGYAGPPGNSPTAPDQRVGNFE